MRKVIALIFAAVTIAGCASASKTYGPDGKEAYALNCSGTARNWGMCMERAGDLCGARGYNIISATGDIGNLAVGAANTTNATLVAGSMMSRSMVIACKS